MKKFTLKICAGKACRNNFSELTKSRAQKEKNKHDMSHVTIEDCSCQSQCKYGPIVVCETENTRETLQEMTPVKIGELMRKLRQQQE